MRIAALAVALFAFWLLLSGMFTPFLLAAGAGVSVAVALLARRMEIADREGHPIHLAAAALTYWPWLAKEIALSAWRVTKIILHPRLPVSPALVRFKPSQRSTVGWSRTPIPSP
jgi:multicomponent Na+:H+ antiporter subunit E